MSQATPPWRQVVVDELRLLASLEEQLAYEQGVPSVDITVELLCGWFDDAYHPDDEIFRSCFSEPELLALAKFNEVYDARATALPPSNGTVRTWHASIAWREVMHAASRALENVAA